MSDFISRQDAIEAVYQALRTPMSDYKNNFFHDSMSLAVNIVKNIPSIEQKGRWQRRKGSDCWECSECHAVLESDDIVRHNFYYCYHCGADMMNEDGYMKLEGTDHE